MDHEPLRPPDPRTAVFPPHAWGSLALRLNHDSQHLTMEIHRQPEGMSLIGRCERCGGRTEGLVDFRFGAAFDFAEASREITTAVEVLVPMALQQWAPAHARCQEEPLRHHVSAAVQRFVEQMLVQFRETLAEGGDPPPLLFLLERGRDGVVVYAFPMDDLPEGESRRIAAAARTYALREFVRTKSIDLLAAVFIAEVWIARVGVDEIGDDADAEEIHEAFERKKRDRVRDEGIAVTVLTPDYALVGLADIGLRDDGPGRDLGDVDWSPCGESPILDGLFAQSLNGPHA
jgi:hypothetical protein